MKKDYLWLIVAVILVGVFILSFGKTGLISGLVWNFSNHALSWLIAIGSFVLLILAFSEATNGENSGRYFFLSILLFVFWILILVFQGPVMRFGLYTHTVYENTTTLVSQNKIRDVPYTVASSNFVGTNPDSMSKPGDLDYVQGRWIASIDPRGFWNTLTRHSEGFFLYDPTGEDPVVRITQKMPFAESGWWFNSSTWFVKSEKYFAEFHEILYIQDSETGEVFAVVSLIGRQGFARWPYIVSVMIVDQLGNIEMLTPSQAENDPRLIEVALRPEWLMKQQVEAYGFRKGILPGLFNRQGRIQVQRSAVNDENSAPFHMETVQGNMWFTPFSPLRSSSLIGIAMASSHDISAPIRIWELTSGDGYGGSDYMASLVEGSPSHNGFTWYREGDNSEGGKITSGNMTVLEMMPVVRAEAEGNHLYYLAYTSTAPNSVKVLFYTVVDPKSQTVFQDLYTAEQIEQWLRGEFELQPQTSDVSICTTSSDQNLSSMSVEDLLSLIEEVTQEIRNR